MKDTKRIFVSVVIILIILAGYLLLAWKFDWQSPYEKGLKEKGNQIVLKVESFREENGRLPDNLRELGLSESEEGPLFYNKPKDGMNYTVSFPGSTLGESTYYDSKDKLWHDF